MFSKLKNYISKNTGILIRLDDIAENMNWSLMEKSEILFDKYKIKPVLGVIPNNQDKELLSHPRKDNFWDLVRGWKNKGWNISMHGLSHVYDKDTKKKDYFGYGGKSEFCGHPLNVQIDRIEKGLKKFREENIKIKSFFAPNHTYDWNTFDALKENGINEIIDGYGLMPYKENEIKFIPQLFYKVYALPFGIQATQIHLNYWKQDDFDNFENFVKKNQNSFITYEDAMNKVNNNIHFKLINSLTKTLLKAKRNVLNFKS
tara:strand:- start:243 stop:1019 length:777 start_codon:yes stop_codon:yes gene_type:complete